ncbi:mitochondrial 54S ribosomal protein bL34m [Thermothelomyces heterothallicus CBS 202.75]|uniref:mitochondrial 54S ribosomal protein bL34m n=1 Tax=Thermothelomyces heterothallicus CBS 202.75 TaxID=1149848 RepID=UPI0037449708
MPPVSLQPPLLLQGALRRVTAQLLPRRLPPPKSTTSRTFSHLPSLRPTLATPSPIFRAPNISSTPSTTAAAATMLASTPTGEVLDVVAKSSVTSHPALAGCGSQIRCGPRPTMSGASRLIQKRRHGFLARKRSRTGRNILKRRMAKGRKKLSHG